MVRLLYAILLGLVGAGIVHIGVLLLVPVYSERDAWSRLAAIAEPYEMVRIDARADAPALMATVDPLFDAYACRFDLADGVLRLSAEGRVPFWSVSIYNRAGQNVFSFGDRTAPGGRLDFVVVSPAQMIGLRSELPDDFADSVFVELDISQGIVVVRGFVPDETWEPQVSRYLANVLCETY